MMKKLLTSLLFFLAVSQSAYGQTLIQPYQGGTGIANAGASTWTINGSYPFAATLSGSTSVTFPTSGTLVAAPVPFSQGGTGLTSAADDTVMVSSGAAWVATALADCPDSAGKHLNYTAATNTFSCGTTSSGGGVASLADPFYANQGTTTTVLHGNAAGNLSFGSVKSADLDADVYSTAHTWPGQQTFVAPILGTPASGVATNLTGTAASLTAGLATNTVAKSGTGSTYLTDTSPQVNSVATSLLTVRSTGTTTNSDVGRIIAASDETSLQFQSHGSARTTTRYGVTIANYTEFLGGLNSASNAAGGNGLLIGTFGTTPVIIGTNQIRAITIDSSQNVGVGTTTPAAKLSINGGLHVGGDSDPGDNNAIIDGTLSVVGVATLGTGAILGTPASGTLTNATGLPVSTGISGLGANVATALATPSSANLASAITDETGTNKIVFSDNPALVNPTVTNYVETAYVPSAGSSFTVSLANGTIQQLATNANVTITLPTPVAGKSYLIQVKYGGAHTVTWAGGGTIKWANGAAPTATSVNGKHDVYTCFSVDTTNTFCADGGRNF